MLQNTEATVKQKRNEVEFPSWGCCPVRGATTSSKLPLKTSLIHQENSDQQEGWESEGDLVETASKQGEGALSLG